MRRYIRKDFHSFEFFRLNESRNEESIVEFRNTSSASNFLLQFLTDTICVTTLRSILQEFNESSRFLTDHQVIDRLAWRLASGQLRVSKSKTVSLARERATPGYPKQAETDTFIPSLPEDKSDEKKSWIEIVLVDEENQPVVDERYQITLPDGSLKTGRTNSGATVRFVDIDPGQCTIKFPDIEHFSG